MLRKDIYPPRLTVILILPKSVSHPRLLAILILPKMSFFLPAILTLTKNGSPPPRPPATPILHKYF